MKLALLLLSLLAASAYADELRLVMWSFPIDVKNDQEMPRVVEVPVELKTDYGYMILNVGTIKEPKPHYILGDRKKGVVRHFKTKKEFLAALEALEPGGELAFYTRCLVPSSLGLKDEELVYEDVERICANRKIELLDEPYMRCLCPDVPDSKR